MSDQCPQADLRSVKPTSTVATIPLDQLAIAFAPVVIVLLVFYWWSLKTGSVIYAFFRMVVQLMLVGYVLVWVFDAEHAGIIGALVSLMVLISTWIALRTVSRQTARTLPGHPAFHRDWRRLGAAAGHTGGAESPALVPAEHDYSAGGDDFFQQHEWHQPGRGPAASRNCATSPMTAREARPCRPR